MGYVFMVRSVPSVISTFIHPFTWAYMPPKLQYMVSFIMASLGFMLVSDAPLFLLPPNSTLTILSGMVLIGFALGM